MSSILRSTVLVVTLLVANVWAIATSPPPDLPPTPVEPGRITASIKTLDEDDAKTLQAAAQSSPEQIAKLIVQLGDDDFNMRKAATKTLIAIGDPALGALKQAMFSKDAEVVARAEVAYETIRQRKAELLRSLRTRGQEAWNQQTKDYKTMAQVYTQLTGMFDPSWEDWQGMGRVHEHQQKWKLAVQAYLKAADALQANINTPIKQFIRLAGGGIGPGMGGPVIIGRGTVNEQLLQKRIGGLDRETGQYQAFIDGQWINVGGDMANVERFVTERRKHLPQTLRDLRLHIGRLQRDRLNDHQAACATFELLIDKTLPTWKLPIAKLAEQRAKNIRGEKTEISTVIKDNHQMTAWRELAASQQRTKPTAKTMETHARLLFACDRSFANSHYSHQRQCAEWLATMYLHQPANTAAPQPFILLSPEIDQIEVDIAKPTATVQPYCSYLTNNANIHWYAFIPPPGMAFESAHVISDTTTKVTISVTRNPPDGKVNYQFHDYRRNHSQKGDRQITTQSLKFDQQTGLLIIEINNAGHAKWFTVKATFQKVNLFPSEK